MQFDPRQRNVLADRATRNGLGARLGRLPATAPPSDEVVGGDGELRHRLILANRRPSDGLTLQRDRFDGRPLQSARLTDHVSQEPGFEYGVTPFYFLRHGETHENREGILQGQNDTELNRAGHEMAEAAARTLLDVVLGSIYASPLKRAWTTALIVSRVTGVQVCSRPGLMERHWGAFEGCPKASRPATPNPETVETVEDFRDRVTMAMESISGPAPVLVVAHSGVFRAICARAGIAKDRQVRLAPGQVARFEPLTASGREWRIRPLAAD
jgi:probable phosphoglycerate mutase